MGVVAGERDRAVSGVVAGVSSSMSIESLSIVGVLDLVVEIEEDIGGQCPGWYGSPMSNGV